MPHYLATGYKSLTCIYITHCLSLHALPLLYSFRCLTISHSFGSSLLHELKYARKQGRPGTEAKKSPAYTFSCEHLFMYFSLEEVVEKPPGVGTFNTNDTVSIKSRSDEDAAALVLDDLKNTNLDTVLYQTPVDQKTIKTT